MNLIYETVRFKGSQDLEKLVTQKMNRISILKPEIVQARVTLSEGASGNLENQICEIRLEIPGYDIFVKKNASTYEQAIRAAVEAVRRKIQRDKKLSKGAAARP